MKPLLSFLLAIVAFGTQAQNTSPYWSLAGNNNASFNSKLGTTNAVSLNLLTNNLTRMRVDSIGKVWIGNRVTKTNATRALNLVDDNAVMRVLRVHASNAPAVELISRTSADGANVAYWDFYANPSDKSFRIRDRVGGGSGLDRVFISSNGNVGIGTNTPSFKLHVEGGSMAGIYATSSVGFGISGVCNVTQEPFIPGVGGRGPTGVQGEGIGYGVYGTSEFGTGVYGFGGLWAGEFDGDVYIAGSYGPSDRKLKQNITDLSTAMELINKLQPKEYEYRRDGNYKLMNLPKGKHYGLIAQDVEQIFPNLTKDAKFDTRKTLPRSKPDTSQILTTQPSAKIDFKTINYTELIPVMVKAMQEQQAQIEQQQQQIEQLKQEISSLKKARNIIAFLSSAELSEASPNPTKGAASIQYVIPEGSRRAELLITDVLGRQIKTIQLTTSGVINVDVTSLASGVYNYSLIIENKTVATRKMTVVK